MASKKDTDKIAKDKASDKVDAENLKSEDCDPEEEEFKVEDLPDSEAEGDPYGPDDTGDAEDEEKKKSKRKDESLSETHESLLPPTYILPRERIFKVGTWNGEKWTAEDVQQMVTNFYTLRSSFEPNMGAGHDAMFHKVHYGEKSLGWVKDLYFEAPFLLADIEVSSDIYNSDLKTKKLRYKSIRVAVDFTRDGKKYGKVLKALDLLGVSTPAVGDLGPVQLPYSDDKQDKLITLDTMYKEEGDKMPAEDIKKESTELDTLKTKLADAEAKLEGYAEKDDKFAELETKVSKFEDLTTRLTTLETQYTAAKQANEMLIAKDIAREVGASADKLITAGKLLPKQRALFCEVLISMDKAKNLSYAEGEETKEYNQAEALVALFESFEPQVDLSGDQAAGDAPAKDSPTGDEAAKLASRPDLERYSEKEDIPIKGQATWDRALELKKELKCDMRTALVKAFAEESTK